MDRATCDLDSVRECLLLRFEPGERGKQRRMDVENALGKLLHEPWGEQTHVSRKAYEVDLVLPEAATISRSCISRPLPFEAMNAVGRLSFFAVSSPPASGLFEITIAIRASGILPEAMLCAMASKFEPRPERSMPRFFKIRLRASGAA